MATKKKTATEKKQYRVARYWPVEYRSYSFVQASSPEEAARLALDDDDYSNQESIDGSDGPTEIEEIVEITPEGMEIEHTVPADGGDAAGDCGSELLAACKAAIHRSIERQEAGETAGVLDDDIFQRLVAAVHRCG